MRFSSLCAITLGLSNVDFTDGNLSSFDLNSGDGLEAKGGRNYESNVVAPQLPLALFYDSPDNSRRKGGIDVSKHSKEARMYPNLTFFGENLDEDFNGQSVLRQHTDEWSPSKTDDNGEDTSHAPDIPWANSEKTQPNVKRPSLKVGIVFPKQIFKQRLYQQQISKALQSVLQEETCNHHHHYLRSTPHEAAALSVLQTHNERWQRSSVFKKPQREPSISLLPSVNKFKDPEVSRGLNSKPVGSLLIDHVRESYNFVWNANKFRLEDELDSINYGELVVSPPPSGKLTFI